MTEEARNSEYLEIQEDLCCIFPAAQYDSLPDNDKTHDNSYIDFKSSLQDITKTYDNSNHDALATIEQ